MANKYQQQAAGMIKGQYESQKNNLQNNFNQNMNELESQKGEINKQYDGYVEDSKNAGEANKQNYNNATLNRGLGRSSVATTGIAGIQNQTDKNIVSINNQRQSQMDNIAKLKDMLRNNLTNSLSAMEAEYNSNVNSLAMQLQQRAEDVAYRNKQLAQQAAQHNAEMAFKNKQLAQQAAQANREFAAAQKWKEKEWEYKTSQNKSSSRTSNYPSASDFKTQLKTLDSRTAVRVLEKNRKELISQYGASGYNSFLETVRNNNPIGYSKYADPSSKFIKYGK